VLLQLPSHTKIQDTSLEITVQQDIATFDITSSFLKVTGEVVDY
jgi:hypothetical protein